MSDEERDQISTREAIGALRDVASFRPFVTVTIIGLSIAAALLEGVGISFILPIVEQTQSTGASADDGGLVGLFAQAFAVFGIPFTLEYTIAVVGAVMTVRFTASFLVDWLKAYLETRYVRHLQLVAFEHAVNARVAYFDDHGSDDILNAIVTQAKYAGQAIQLLIRTFEISLLCLMYLAIALYLAPVLTLATAAALAVVLFLFRFRLESGFAVGSLVADANERLQETAQAGTQGIRDVKTFGMGEELIASFERAVDTFSDASIRLARNKAAMQNFYQLATAITVFALIYFALSFADLSLGRLGVYLFAVFRLGPYVSTLNNQIYAFEGNLPHLVRTQAFIAELGDHSEDRGASASVPARVDRTRFRDVSFAYPTSDRVLESVSFGVDRGEFVAFVGQSGAGKSTIVSLLAAMYEPDSGEITANGEPIIAFDPREWRDRVSVVRQNPHIFNDTLAYNLTVGNRDATREEIDRVCEIAQVSEFFDDLPAGYDTELGDDGVKLSGGQKQRVAVARALLKDADLLLLDEATSDLDTRLERRVHDGIEAMDRDYAMVVVAHRLSTVTNADRIYTMADGSIVEVGPHEDLVERGGQYASLYSVQT